MPVKSSSRSIAKAAKEGPYAWVIPADDPKPVECADLVNLLELSMGSVLGRKRARRLSRACKCADHVRARGPGLGGGHEDREQAAGESALNGHRQVELSFAFAVDKGARRVGAFAFEQAQQRVIVSVEERREARRIHCGNSVLVCVQSQRASLP
jgi:hypothetical protein